MGSVRPHLLVTGATGFVGARVVRLALAREFNVTAAVGPASSLQRLAGLKDRVAVARVDIADEAAVEHLVSTAPPQVCIHLAGDGAVVREDNTARLMAVNAQGPALLADALARSGCRRLVTAGSSSEYGTVTGPMDEALAASADDAYGVSKLAGGLLARVVGRQQGLETAHLRLFSVYGPGEDPRRLVPSVIAALLDRVPVDLTPGGQVRDFVYVDDVAEALLAATEQPGVDGMTLNVGSGVETTVGELCRTVADLAGASHELLRFGARPYRPGERFKWRAATARAEHALGWRARTPLTEGLARMLEAAVTARTVLVAP